MHFRNPIFRHYLILAVGFLSLFLVAVMTKESLNIFLVVIWWLFIVAAMFVSGKCGNCGEPIIFVRWSFSFPRQMFPKKCDRCGAPYDRP